MKILSKAFYAVACLSTGGMVLWGAYVILSVGLRSTIFTEADRTYYTAERTEEEVKMRRAATKEEMEEVDRKNAVARRQEQFAWAFPVLLVNFPVFLWSYRNFKKDFPDEGLEKSFREDL